MPDEDQAVKGTGAGRRDERRRQRRTEMVAAAMAAVRRSGPGVSVAEIAAHAGITKPVLYRYFADRADLHRAVAEAAAAELIAGLAAALATERPPRARVAAVVDAFLAHIEADTELWRFVVHGADRPGTGGTGGTGDAGVVRDAREAIAAMLATVMGEQLRGAGLDSGGAEAWAHGLVGMMQSAGDWWLERRTMSRAALTGYLTTMVWGGISGVLGPPAAGPPAQPEPATGLRLVPGPTAEGTA